MIQEHQTLDCKHLNCPMPIVQIAKAVKTLTSGQVLKVEATDPAFRADVEAWVRRTGNKLVGYEEGAVKSAFIEKA